MKTDKKSTFFWLSIVLPYMLTNISLQCTHVSNARTLLLNARSHVSPSSGLLLSSSTFLLFSPNFLPPQSFLILKQLCTAILLPTTWRMFFKCLITQHFVLITIHTMYAFFAGNWYHNQREHYTYTYKHELLLTLISGFPTLSSSSFVSLTAHTQ